ncbi:hypothetical protein RhiirA4_432605 [Rhizophagus irregularis]|uniref:Uncharacterized protein n=1 Tax=Rhizophagus irregularis TaxID=588596 RepID=A0A2I1G2J3_9GLOM|nr:hypothetical protein RhiirA4_416187 [Rhizophagus irregularis]PKY62555.1 hypothetical protein RhiirA4_432605 [Rhizophagus irregularis]
MGRSHKKTLVNRQNTRIVIEDHPDEANDHTPLFTLEAPLSSEEEEADSGNESGYASTIGNMQYMQNQMFTIIQDVQKKINEMFNDFHDKREVILCSVSRMLFMMNLPIL